MTLTTAEPDLKTLEETALERLALEEGHVEADLEASADTASAGPDASEERPSLRPVVALAFPTVGAALMVGGIFSGLGGRVTAVVSGLLGIALAAALSRVRRALTVNVGLLLGVLGIGLLMLVPHGLGAVTAAGSLASKAAAEASVLRPPAPLDPGWQAIIGWIMAVVGVVLTWTATVLRRPTLGFLLSLPVSVAAGISVDKDAQVASGIVLVILFGIGIGILSGADADNPGEGVRVAYEVRRMLRAVPLIALCTVVLIALSQTDFLFPKPAYDPSQQPPKPKAVPLSEVPDRVLFSVKSTVQGPWRVGTLDVYDGEDWRLPPYDRDRLDEVPDSGVLSTELTPGQKAEFTMAGLTGAVLPGLPNMVAVVADAGPELVFDPRNGHLRVDQGQIEAGFVYSVTAAALPTIETLRKLDYAVPAALESFVDMPLPPAAVVELIGRAPKTSKWDEFDFVRSWLLENVTVAGTGTPTRITPDKVADMVAGSRESSPFELVAAQAMAARWIGLPARIGYGFDGGEEVDGRLEVRPRHGASFVEVYFPTFGWLPVIGTPAKAKPTVAGDPTTQQTNSAVAPSDDISVQLYIPQLTDPPSVFFEALRRFVAMVAAVLAVLGLLWLVLPVALKARRRSVRRRMARAGGPTSRIALAYAEWREAALDYGFRHDTDTPLMFLTRFAPDAEHRELAWLVTRCLWGDLAGQATDEHAAVAEELARALRRRIASAQPVTVRLIAAVSRISLRSPFLDDADLITGGGSSRHEPAAA
jgi:hypothetical protein